MKPNTPVSTLLMRSTISLSNNIYALLPFERTGGKLTADQRIRRSRLYGVGSAGSRLRNERPKSVYPELLVDTKFTQIPISKHTVMLFLVVPRLVFR